MSESSIYQNPVPSMRHASANHTPIAQQAIPDPDPLPFPLPPDWWRCLRIGSVSGRYEGAQTAPVGGRMVLDLRVDIDPQDTNRPVLDRISGDVYQSFNLSLPGRPPLRWRVYRHSWIVDAPIVNWSRCDVVITGAVRYWQGTHPATTIEIRIPWATFQPAGPAEVSFLSPGAPTERYSCARQSDCFREFTLEIDVCQSVNTAPILPAYHSHAHNTRPGDLPARTLTLEEAYRDTGVCVSVRPERTIIDDSDPEFTRWSPAELHDAMETHFSQHAGTWPNWQMWGLLAGTFDSLGTAGIMFDAAARYGGAGEAPDRQGFAVFRNHPWYNDLTDSAPTNQAQAQAMRDYLYTWVHEAGHAFNFLHSWDKGRPDAQSWMNYPSRYDARNGVDSFWNNFRFQFDTEELLHLRHGDRNAVIMGADPWASGGHLDAPVSHLGQLEGHAPIELLVRSQETFGFMEQVTIELRLRNLMADLPIDLDTRLNPEYGGVAILIQRPDGRTVQYAPLLCQLADPKMLSLQPQNSTVLGSDRYSETVVLSYGGGGFYFDAPGQYLVQAIYQGAGDLLIPSNVHRIRIGHPASKEEEYLAQEFFNPEVGLSLYLNGSQSPYLAKGMACLESMADRYRGTTLGHQLATTLAHSVSRPFFRIPDTAQPVLKKVHNADPQKALELTQPVLTMYQDEKRKAFNIAYHQLVRYRAALRSELGQAKEAKKELSALQRDLKSRGVNASVLDDLKAYEASL